MAVGSIDRLLAAMNVEIDAVALCDIAPDAALIIRPLNLIEVHFVLDGEVHVGTGSTPAIKVEAGGILLVPAGLSQRVAGSTRPTREVAPASVERELPSGLAHFATGGSGGARVICGTIEAGIGGSFGLFDGLNGPLHVQLSDNPMVLAAFTAMHRECEDALVGGQAFLSALMKACLILMLRKVFAESNLAELSWIYARPSLLRAILAVVERPEAAHSVASLAAAAGMSRSGFARQFASSVRVRPMEFVAQARIARARHLLTTTELPVALIASNAGFASRSHFSRSFRTAVGADPTSFRDGLKEVAHVRHA